MTFDQWLEARRDTLSSSDTTNIRAAWAAAVQAALAVVADAETRYTGCPKRRQLCRNLADRIRQEVT